MLLIADCESILLILRTLEVKHFGVPLDKTIRYFVVNGTNLNTLLQTKDAFITQLKYDEYQRFYNSH